MLVKRDTEEPKPEDGITVEMHEGEVVFFFHGQEYRRLHGAMAAIPPDLIIAVAEKLQNGEMT